MATLTWLNFKRFIQCVTKLLSPSLYIINCITWFQINMICFKTKTLNIIFLFNLIWISHSDFFENEILIIPPSINSCIYPYIIHLSITPEIHSFIYKPIHHLLFLYPQFVHPSINLTLLRSCRSGSSTSSSRRTRSMSTTGRCHVMPV